MTQLSDEILIAYADGELAPAQVSVVDGVLAGDSETMERYQHQQAINKRLTQAFSSMLAVEVNQQAAERSRNVPPPPLSQEVTNRQSEPKNNIMVPAIAASVALVMAGALGGYFISSSPNAGGQGGDPFGTASFWNKDQMKVEEARSQALFNTVKEPETTAATIGRNAPSASKWYLSVAERHKTDAANLLEHYKGKSRNREMALFQFSTEDVAPSMIPVLKDEELTFVGASPVQIKGQKYARLAYRDLSNGAVPVGLYVGKANSGSLTLERGYRENDNYVRWRQGARSYMLIGAVPHWRLIVMSVSVQRQLVQ